MERGRQRGTARIALQEVPGSAGRKQVRYYPSMPPSLLLLESDRLFLAPAPIPTPTPMPRRLCHA